MRLGRGPERWIVWCGDQIRTLVTPKSTSESHPCLRSSSVNTSTTKPPSWREQREHMNVYAVIIAGTTPISNSCRSSKPQSASIRCSEATIQNIGRSLFLEGPQITGSRIGISLPPDINPSLRAVSRFTPLDPSLHQKTGHQ